MAARIGGGKKPSCGGVARRGGGWRQTAAPIEWRCNKRESGGTVPAAANGGERRRAAGK